MIKNTLRHIPAWSFWDDVFSDEEIEKICAQCQSLELQAATINQGDVVKDIRESDIRFVTRTIDNQWIFDRLNWVIEHINENWYGFDLEGYDSFQYTEYDSSRQGHYDLHMDTFLGRSDLMRKLSLTLTLNDDYKGGDFQIQTGQERQTLPQKKGRILAFPSFVLHGVTPVTEGIRRSIVVWVLGPIFK